MALSSEEVKARIAKPNNRDQLNIAALHEDRVKFCVKKCLEYNRPTYTATHLQRISNLLPIPKYQKYLTELTFPLPIMETADVIYSGLYKIFDAQNKAIYPILSSEDLEQEFTEYLQELGFTDFWQTTAWQAFRDQPNCVMVIDMTVKQVGSRPQPYICAIDITATKDLTLDSDGITFLDYIFVNENGDLVAIDDQNFYTYPKMIDANGVVVKNEWQIDDIHVTVGFHGLGYCPAKFLIDDALDNKQPIIKESPVTKVLYPMEKLLFRIISGENLEDYASYPIHVIPKTECTYQDEQGNRCNAGFITRLAANAPGMELYGSAGGNYQIACPVCSQNHLVGAGSAYEAQPDVDGKFDVDNVVKIIPAPTETLQYIDTKIESRKNNIIQSCIGAVQDPSKEAMNEKQVTSMYEDRQTILLRVKRNFERAIKFCMDTIGKLQYESAYTGSVVNLGTRFLLLTTEEMQARLDGAVKSNAPQYEINLIREEMNVTEYSNNPRMMQRMKILEKLEPYPNYAEADISKLYFQNKISQINFELKYNFSIFIAQFEDENGDIIDFGSLLTPSKKIQIIKSKLLEYVNEYIKQYGVDLETAGEGAGDSSGQGAGSSL
jgi:hypothetical protein